MKFTKAAMLCMALTATLAPLRAGAASNTQIRKTHYRPDGISAVCTDGQTKFNRALYGAHSGFRMECSDMPEFGIYLPRMGGNLRLTLPQGSCTARYTPGRMDYSQGGIEVEAQVMRSTDMALWRLTNTTASAVTVPVRFGGVADKKFFREGDLGVDDPTCFDLKPEYCKGNIFTVNGDTVRVEYGNKQRAQLSLLIPAAGSHISELPVYEGEIVLAPGESKYIALLPSSVSPAGFSIPAMMKQAESERDALASAVSISTPDPWLNPIGSAMSVAADGIWSGRAWLHGSIGWRTPHLGWRGAYVGNAIGRHDRALTHFATYADNQVTDIPATLQHPCQDSTLNLARAEKRWGTPMYSNGYICRRPGKKGEMSHYDMNLVYIDALMRHFRHTGDTAAMRRFFPVIKRHLAWEKLNFDPDGDHLYDAYCCIWASDALYYSGGAVTHSSAYNRFANLMAARVAQIIGEDPTPYLDEAEAIGKAIDATLWMPERGHWAEFKDAGGKQRLHPSAAVWTIYHAIDSEIADPFQAYAATCYVDSVIPHIPVLSDSGVDNIYTISTTNWKPYSWSINNVAIAEVMHTALAYWQAGRSEEACRLMKAVVMDNMYLGASPLNFGQISHYDAVRGESYRDFADPIGVWSRALTEGLFGIRPDMTAATPRVEIIPGFPSDWNSASINLPDIAYSFRRDGDRLVYTIDNRYRLAPQVLLTVPVHGVRSVKVNGRTVAWENVDSSIGTPRLRINAGNEPQLEVVIETAGELTAIPTGRVREEGPVKFTEMADGVLKWWTAEISAHRPFTAVAAPGFDDINPARCETVDLRKAYNASVTDIFRNRYLSPRPQVTTLQIPAQGIGEWCHPKLTAEIDDSGLRSRLDREKGRLVTELGIPFALPAKGSNVIYTSLWDNYPDRASVKLSGKASHLYLVMAGSTNHMQSGIENGKIRIRYKDGSESVTPLVNPHNWAPIEQDFYNDNHAFALAPGTKPLYRMHLQTGHVARDLAREVGKRQELESTGADGDIVGTIPGGAAVVLDIPADPKRKLESLEIETLSGDVVIGLMGITLQRP